MYSVATPTNYSRIVLRHIFRKLRSQGFRSSKVRRGIKHMGPSMAAVGVGHRMGGEGLLYGVTTLSAPRSWRPKDVGTAPLTCVFSLTGEI